VADSTREIVQIAAVLVVGGTRPLIKAVHEVVRGLQGAEVVSCGVREAPTRTAELRPFAIVMNEDVHAFDALEFDALARDVRAELIVAPCGTRGLIRSADELATTLGNAFERRRASLRRRSGI
jgi:hypothetical protein